MQNMTVAVSAATTDAATASSSPPPPTIPTLPSTANVSPAGMLFDKLSAASEFVPGKSCVQENFQFLLYIGRQDDVLRSRAEKSLQCSTEIAEPTEVDDAACSERRYHALPQLTKGATSEIVRATKEEAFRALHQRFGGHAEEALSILQKIMKSEIGTGDQPEDKLKDFKLLCSTYDDHFDTLGFEDEIKRAPLSSSSSEPVRSHLQLTVGNKSCEDMMAITATYLITKRATGLKSPQDDREAMEIDAVERFAGYGNNCGKWGQWRRKCCAKGGRKHESKTEQGRGPKGQKGAKD